MIGNLIVIVVLTVYSAVLLTVFWWVVANFYGAIFRKDKYVPFLAIKKGIVDEMLDIAKVTKNDKLADLGSGIGTIIFRAADTRSCEATGVELNILLHQLTVIRRTFSRNKGKIKLVHGDLLNLPLAEFSVITIFLTPNILQNYLTKKLEAELKPGTRVVSHAFEIESDKFERFEFPTKTKSLNNKIFLYVKK
jgi:SAM-dependent methyltransferase